MPTDLLQCIKLNCSRAHYNDYMSIKVQAVVRFHLLDFDYSCGSFLFWFKYSICKFSKSSSTIIGRLLNLATLPTEGTLQHANSPRGKILKMRVGRQIISHFHSVTPTNIRSWHCLHDLSSQTTNLRGTKVFAEYSVFILAPGGPFSLICV